jgi:Zn-dependent peptidase ImmA (M78 family)/transcriptional regulator with XRE-family HTH domain
MKRGTPGFVGARLREAREARGLTATALSELLGVSRQAVSQYENDAQNPRTEIMEEIVRTLRFPPDFFLRRKEPTPSRKIFYRSMSAATKAARVRMEHRHEWLADIVDYLREFVELPPVNFPRFDLPQDPHALSEDDIEFLAAETRKFWGMGDGPVGNLVWLLENNGTIIARGDMGAHTLDAFSDWYDTHGTPYIFLSADKESGVRSRFDAAHELGHLVLHRDIGGKYLTRTPDFRLIENQAHRFAGAFLLPASTFADDLYSANLEAFKAIKTKWNVSIASMLYRSKDLDIVNEEQAGRLWRNLSRRGWRLKEPLDDQLPIEQPRLLRRAFELLIDEGVQTRAQIRGAFPYALNDIEELASLPPGFLDEKPAPISLKAFSRKRHGGGKDKQSQGLGEVVNFRTTSDT